MYFLNLGVKVLKATVRNVANEEERVVPPRRPVSATIKFDRFQHFEEKCKSDVVKIGSTIIFHLSEL